MAVKFALENLFDEVVARFAAEGTEVENVFGWRAKSKGRAGVRIIWEPGDTAGGMGEITGPKRVGQLTRQLGNLNELFTCYFVAHDPSAHEDGRKQYNAARRLFDAWFRAVYLAAHGTFGLQSPQWLIGKNERRHGAALYVVGMIQAPLLDAVHEQAPADTAAEIDVEQTDVVEQIIVIGA